MDRNLNYWDSVSTLAGEVPVPHKTFPRALCAAVILVVVTYAVPLMIGLGVTRTIEDWKLGYFSYIAQKVGLSTFRSDQILTYLCSCSCSSGLPPYATESCISPMERSLHDHKLQRAVASMLMNLVRSKDA